MVIKSTSNVNIVHSTGNGYFQIVKNGYYIKGTSAADGWNSYDFNLLTNGIKVTVYYSHSGTVKVWAGGRLIVNATDTISGNAIPSIYAFAATTISDIKVWTEQKDYVRGVDSQYIPSSYGKLGIENNGIVTVAAPEEAVEGSYALFKTNLKANAGYYMSMNLKSSTATNAISVTMRENAYISFQQYGYQVVGDGSSWVNWSDIGGGFSIADGLEFLIYCDADSFSLWINGQRVVNDSSFGEAVANAMPGISWVKEGSAEISNIKIWTPDTLGDLYVDYEAMGINAADVVYMVKHLVDPANNFAVKEEADVNLDGKVNLKDLIRLKKKVAGIADFG